MKQIYLVRHCKAEGQEPDAKLTDEGHSQVVELTSFFRNKSIDYIISSPYERAFATIQPLAGERNLVVQIDERLKERVLSGTQRPDWRERLRESFDDLDVKLPGGESSREAMQRGIKLINDINNKHYKSVVVVTHGNLLSLMINYFNKNFGYEDWMMLSNPDVYELQFSDDGELKSMQRIWK